MAIATLLASIPNAHAAVAYPLAGYNGAAGFRLDGAAEGDRSGYSVAPAGDVNGDGIDDIVIGAFGADPNGAASGSTYVVFGTAAAIASPLQLSSLDGTLGFRLDGAAADDRSGFAVAGGSDLNGDGIDDLVIGAPGADPNGAASGSAYVVFGRAAGGFAATIALASLDGTAGFRLDGAAAGDEAGSAVAFAGDLDDDGVADLAIGARGADANGDRSGSTYVVFGRAAGGFAATIALAALDGATGFRLHGAAGEESGAAVAAAGDVDGDGDDDLVIGAPFADPNGDFSGSSYVVYGRATPAFAASFDLATLDGANGFRLDGVAFNDRSGSAVAGAGDVNGDGVHDLAVGAFAADPGDVNAAGSTFVVYGRATGAFAATMALASLDGTNGYRIDGAATGDVSGRAVSAGDINGDGTDDFAIGADLADAPAVDAGRGYVVFGSTVASAPVRNLAALTGGDGVRFDGVAAFDQSSFALASAGDFNDDGIDDLLIGAERADPNGSASGSSYLVYGNAAPLRNGAALLAIGTVLEDQGAAAGVTLGPALAGSYLDAQPFAGIALTQAPSTANGAWQYSVDAGANWVPVAAALSPASATVLAPTAQLRFVPAPNFSGDSPPLLARMWDGADGHAPGEGRDIAASIGSLGGFSNDANALSLVVAVAPVNDAPSFAASDPPPAVASGAEVVVPSWALFSAGPPSESAQTVDAYLVAVGNPTLFSQLPTVDQAGTLRYTPAAGATGTSSLAVRVRDNGGTANGGIDTSAQQDFTITLTSASDPIFSNGFE